ncbi:NAD(P)-dependent oxidoreductase [Hymenobacter properus]|uniref:NAD(P)H-binding protein n=1 Tax=Hymenobacter properus TaxID=2791026 RepID=A0A931BJG0_9BACT|nr:NAD(P)H-binding protein [Hymenobacter properus]MBF9143631.1 NAD(P)H-binding protein [Hymenobacter properus]MBR7722444.1 NAD(P)H-binding protein [Microvirga sp. SRT04]
MNLFNSSSLALLGGAGKAGFPVVQAALQAGHRVRVLLRHPAQFAVRHERLTILEGDARDPVALRQLLAGSSALISTLGNPRGESVPILSSVTAHLLALLPELGIRRYITVTSLYDTDQPQPDAATRQAAAYMEQHFPAFMADRHRELALLASSPLDWTCVRLPLVVEAPATGIVQTSLTHRPGPQIAAADLAQFLLGQLSSDKFLRQCPFVAN